MSESMVIDPSEFNFLDMSDVMETNLEGYKVTDNAPMQKTTNAQAKGRAEQQARRDGLDFNDAFDEPEEFDFSEPEEESEIDDILASGADEKAKALDVFNALDDETPIDFNGLELTKAQTKELFKQKQQIDEQREYMNTISSTVDQANDYTVKQLTRAQTAVDLNIKTLQSRLERAQTNHEYGEIAKELRQAEQAQGDLNQLTDNIMARRNQVTQEATRYRITNADAALAAEIPDWQNKRPQVLEYIASTGMQATTLEKIYDKPTMIAFMKAMAFDKNKARIAEKAKAVTSAAQNARSTPSAPKKKLDPAKEELAKKITRGQVNASDWFSNLED